MTLDECEKIFYQALSSKTESAFCYAIEPLFKEYEVLWREFFYPSKSTYWRARLIENNKVYSNISELNYPPPDCVKEGGRLNDKGDPCFYASIHGDTALAEIGAMEGQLVQVAGFKIRNGSSIRLAILGEYANIQKYGHSLIVTNEFAGTTVNEILNAMPPQKVSKVIKIDKFFAGILGGNNYLFSRALSKIIYSGSDCNGFAYPNIKGLRSVNIGMQPEASDKSFYNAHCIVVRVTKKRCFGFIDFDLIKSAECLDAKGNFIWLKTDNPVRVGTYNGCKREGVGPLRYADTGTDNKLLNILLKILHCRRRLKGASE